MTCDIFAFFIGKIEQTIVIVANLHTFGNAFVYIKSFCNQPCVYDIDFVDFKIFKAFVFDSSSTYANNIFCRKGINNGFRLCGVVGMLLVDNNDKFGIITMSLGNAVK